MDVSDRFTTWPKRHEQLSIAPTANVFFADLTTKQQAFIQTITASTFQGRLLTRFWNPAAGIFTHSATRAKKSQAVKLVRPAADAAIHPEDVQ